MKIQNRVPLAAVEPDGFLASYQRLVRNTVIPYQYEVLHDRAEGVEKSNVVNNFIHAGKALRGEDTGEFYGMVFQDSDAAKWIEAAAYSLASAPDAELEKQIDELVDLIADAQDEDGYLNTYYTIKDRDKRWTNLLEGHELYCSGHMMEAACAYYEATGKDKLLKVMTANAEHIYRIFIEEGHEGYPGHPEIELALMKMYRTKGDKRFLKLAKHFLDVRGVDRDFYKKEKEKRSWTVWGNNAEDLFYQQSHCPVREMDKAVGHAVRAVYLYTAMADLASETEDAQLFSACKRLWESITQRQMYITGGIGSTVNGEAFSTDYDLPNDTAYAETCASIGLMFFASRMLEQELDGCYADVMEQAFYNTVLAGIQLDGKRFFYVNPLEIVPGISGCTSTHWHTKTQRPGWYACACCPPNAARLLSSYYSYAYGENDSTAYCHLFAAGKVRFQNGVQLVCETEYPYGFTVKYHIVKGGNLAVRIPGWSRETTLSINGRERLLETDRGYMYLSTSDGDVIEIQLDDSPRMIYASARVPELTGCAAVCRGPLVYCFEGIDNDGDVLSLILKSDGCIEMCTEKNGLPAEIITLRMEAVRMEQTEGLYSDSRPVFSPCTATAVPYYAWGNRGENQMRVWMSVMY